VVKVRVGVPDYARSAKTLGTEREGSGVLIDAKGHILTIGYLILEAETLEVVGPDGKGVSAQAVAYDQKTGFGILKSGEAFGPKADGMGKSSEVKEGDPGSGGDPRRRGRRHGGPGHFPEGVRRLLGISLEDAIFTAPPHPNFGGRR